jgi:hypothetical protein
MENFPDAPNSACRLRFSREFTEYERQPDAVVIKEETLVRDGFGAQPKFRRRTIHKIMEVAVGLEPTKTGFADRRLDHFGIATFENPVKTLLNLYPILYPKLYPNCPRIAYLRLFWSR